MDLGDSLQHLGNKTTVITAVVTKIIKDIFFEEKNIDISPYLSSIGLIENTILVKTSNPMMNAELLLLSDKIEASCKKSLIHMGVDVLALKIKYI